MQLSIRRHFPRRRFLGAATVVATGLVVAACSSSGGGSTASGSSDATTAPATSSATSTAASGAGDGSVASLVATAMKAPTKIFQTVPLKSKPANKTLIFLRCELPTCADIGSGVQAGAAALGWTYKTISFKTSDPTTLISAMKQALQYKPFAVVFSGAPQAEWASQIPSYKAAGAYLIPVVTGPTTTSTTVPVEIGDFTDGGVALGNWLTQDSGGKGHALIEDVPSFPILTEYANGIKQAVSAHCTGCQLTSFNGTPDELGNGSLVPSLISQLKRDPSINYVLSTDLEFLAELPSQLKAAGITNVKIAGGQPEPTDLQNIKTGVESAAALISNPILGWMAVDSAARLSEGMTVPAGDSGAPQQLLTKANVTSNNLDDYVLPKDYPAQFKTLWQVG